MSRSGIDKIKIIDNFTTNIHQFYHDRNSKSSHFSFRLQYNLCYWYNVYLKDPPPHPNLYQNFQAFHLMKGVGGNFFLFFYILYVLPIICGSQFFYPGIPL